GSDSRAYDQADRSHNADAEPKTPPVRTGFFRLRNPLLRQTRTEKQMTTRIEGIWLPLVTPFRDGALDERSLRRMARHYVNEPIDGMILAATTGEGLTIDDAETDGLVEIVTAEVAGRIPVFLGISG